MLGELLPAKKPDLDNYCKSILDGINGVVVRDDAQVCALNAVKAYGGTPGVSVTIERYLPTP